MPKKAGMEAWKKKRRQEHLEKKKYRYYIPNLPKLLYIGSKPIPQTAYKINDCGSFFFTNICINDII